MRQHIVGWTAVGAASVLLLSGCAGGGGQTKEADFSDEAIGTLRAWGFENADDVGQARLDYAADALPDVELELDATAFDAQKLTTRFASNDIFDVVQMDRRFVAQYAAQGLLQPLDACYDARDIDPDSRWYESVVDDVTYAGQVWAAPQFYQPPAILLNMEVLDEAGVSPEEIDPSQPDVLLAAIERMYEAESGVPTRLGFDPAAAGNTGLWILSQGGQITDAEGMPTLDNPSNTAGIELLQRIVDAQGGYAAMRSFTDSFDTFGDQNQFVANQVAAQINQQWYPNVLTPYISEIDVRAVPFRAADGEPFAVAGGSSFVIPTGASNPAAACAWIDLLTDQEAWLAAGEARAATRTADGGINTGLFTGSPDADVAIREEYVAPSGNVDFDEVIATYYDVVTYGSSYFASPAGQTITNELNNAVTAALLGDKTPEEALSDAQAAAMRDYEAALAQQQ